MASLTGNGGSSATKNMSDVHGVLEFFYSYVYIIDFKCNIQLFKNVGPGMVSIPHNYFVSDLRPPCLHIRSTLNPLGLTECWGQFFGFRFMAPFGVIAIIVTTWMDHGLIAIRLESLKPPCGKVLLVKCNNQPFAKHGTSWETENLDHRNPWIKN